MTHTFRSVGYYFWKYQPSLKTEFMLVRSFFAVLLTMVLFGCATSSKTLNQVSVGMTKTEVTQVMGQPESTRANEGVEYLVYNLDEGTKFVSGIGFVAKNDKYFVKFVAGRVVSYGRVGDFDSTKQ